MAQLIGTVTRKIPDTITAAQQTAQGNVGCFVARNGQGVKINDFRSMQAARAAVQRAFGQQLRWTREDLRGGIERWVARGPLLDPLDIYSDLLLEWNEMAVGVQVAPASSDIILVGDQALQQANLVQPTTAQSPALTLGPGGLPSALFNPVTNDQLSAPTTLDPALPYTISIVASRDDVTADRHLFSSQLAGAVPDPLRVFLVAGGRWAIDTSLGTTASVVGAVQNQPYCVQLVYRPGPPSATELYVNGTQIIANAGTFDAASTIYVGGDYNGAAATNWSGLISFFAIAQDATDQNRRAVLNYATKRYLQ